MVFTTGKVTAAPVFLVRSGRCLSIDRGTDRAVECVAVCTVPRLSGQGSGPVIERPGIPEKLRGLPVEVLIVRDAYGGVCDRASVRTAHLGYLLRFPVGPVQ